MGSATPALIIVTVVLGGLALLAVAGPGVTAQAQPLEECFTDVAEVIPPDPQPGDVIKVRYTNCEAPRERYYAVYFYPASGGYDILAAGRLSDYIFEFYLNLPNEDGCLELWLDDVVLKRVAVGVAECSWEAPAPDPPETTTITETALVDLGELDTEKMLILGGLGVATLAVFIFALRRGGR